MNKPAAVMKCFLSGKPCVCGTCNSAGAARVAAKKPHPWRKWVDNPSDKQKSDYNPKNRVVHQDRMGLK